MGVRDLQAEVDSLMDGLRADLERLAAIPSIAFPGFPAEPVREAHDLLVGLICGFVGGVDVTDARSFGPSAVSGACGGGSVRRGSR
ncbi:hypothetical protein [Streptomyces sp. NPDC056938]|uniref:hypothetical protein n=1 Tax=unclassified Streptomyces TaxID=2593676 RepID=UPI0036421460